MPEKMSPMSLAPNPPTRPGRRRAARRAAAKSGKGTARVVLLALLGVRERVVGALDFLELLLGFRIVGVAVRVVLAGQLPVGLLDLLGRSAFGDAQDFVEVLSQGQSSLAHHDSRRPDQLAVEPVALLHHLDHGPGLGTLQRLRRKRLVEVGSNLSPWGRPPRCRCG